MKMLDLDFRQRRRHSLLGLLLLVAGLLACGLVLADLSETRGMLDEERSALARFEAARPAPEPPSVRTRAAQARAAKAERETVDGARAVAGRLAIPWGPLLAAIEQSEGADVAITALSPDPEKRRIRIDAQARDLRSMLRYNARLANSPVLADVALINHEVVFEDPDQPVRFSLSATWRQIDDGTQ
ncbi:MAG: hypothetical protein KDH20_04395 [Rhodocyclaceae bacterium]|nr:hypothetical protein [Rhodocyclaceae bacterium]